MVSVIRLDKSDDLFKANVEWKQRGYHNFIESYHSQTCSHRTKSRLSPNSQEQAKWIVRIAKVKSPTGVRREIRKFFKVTPRKVPHVQEFQRINDRFQKSSSVIQQKPQQFQGRIIRRYASIPWLARNLDLIPLFYRFWSHCTERVTELGP